MRNPIRRLILSLRRVNYNPRPLTEWQAALMLSGMKGRAARALNSVRTMKGW